MATTSWETEPASLPVGDATISAQIRQTGPEGDWHVTVVISRAPDQPLLDASEVTSELIDQAERPVAPVDRDTGLLVEAGTSLSASTNANFRFDLEAAPPRELRISYRGQEVRFRPRPSGP